VGIAIVTSVIIAALFAPYIAPTDPKEMDPMNALQGPNREHLFGTDQFGRDVLSRVIFGSRISLRIGLVVVFITAILGGCIGILSGYFRALDNAIMRIVDALMALPAIVLALAIVSILGPSEFCAIIALSVVYTPRTARLVRGSVLVLREKTFVEASKAIGSKSWRILAKDIFPNCLAPLIVQATFVFGYAVMSEAALSFLGAGPPPPAPSWGNIMSEGRHLLRSCPWIILFPGLAIAFTVLGINLLGDGIRDVTDPRMLR